MNCCFKSKFVKKFSNLFDENPEVKSKRFKDFRLIKEACIINALKKIPLCGRGYRAKAKPYSL